MLQLRQRRDLLRCYPPVSPHRSIQLRYISECLALSFGDRWRVKMSIGSSNRWRIRVCGGLSDPVFEIKSRTEDEENERMYETGKEEVTSSATTASFWLLFDSSRWPASSRWTSRVVHVTQFRKAGKGEDNKKIEGGANERQWEKEKKKGKNAKTKEGGRERKRIVSEMSTFQPGRLESTVDCCCRSVGHWSPSWIVSLLLLSLFSSVFPAFLFAYSVSFSSDLLRCSWWPWSPLRTADFRSFHHWFCPPISAVCPSDQQEIDPCSAVEKGSTNIRTEAICYFVATIYSRSWKVFVLVIYVRRFSGKLEA